MAKIITTSELQKHIGLLLAYVTRSWVIVTKKGKPTAVMLPYFEENENAIAEYLEEYDMEKNRTALNDRYAASAKSGRSDMTI